MSSCPLCKRVSLLQKKEYAYLIHEFEHSFLVLGESQFHRGYSLLILKEHVREMTDVSPSVYHAVCNELRISSLAIQKVYKPSKMNLASLGNQVPHLHWHLFPRYETDPNFKEHPWFESEKFQSKWVSPEPAQIEIKKIKSALT